MGIESILSVAAPIAGGLLGGGGSKQSGTSTSTSTSQTTLDPAIQKLIFGGDGSQGLLSRYSSLLDRPQDANQDRYGQIAQNYLGTYGADDYNAIHNTANGLMGGNTAALAGIPAYAVGNKVQAPAQNGIDLTSSYNSLLSGGDTSKLMSSLQAGNALTSAQLQQNQANLTDNLQKNVLPSIRSNSVLAGQYGGSRQGIAEGNAISDFTKQLNDSATQIGLANSANTASQLAGAYENGQQRKLAATQGLGAQQYATAMQNANTANQAEFMNVGNSYDASKFNASTTNQVNQANSGNRAAGAGILGGLMGQAYGVGTNQNNYQLGQYGAINSLLAPYLNANATTTTTGTQPLYQNQGAGILGGISSGLGIFNNMKSGGLFGSSGGSGAVANVLF